MQKKMLIFIGAALFYFSAGQCAEKIELLFDNTQKIDVDKKTPVANEDSILIGSWKSQYTQTSKLLNMKVSTGPTVQNVSEEMEFFQDGTCKISLIMPDGKKTFSTGLWSYKNNILQMNTKDGSSQDSHIDYNIVMQGKDSFIAKVNPFAYSALIKTTGTEIETVNCIYDSNDNLITTMTIKNIKIEITTTPKVFKRIGMQQKALPVAAHSIQQEKIQPSINPPEKTNTNYQQQKAEYPAAPARNNLPGVNCPFPLGIIRGVFTIVQSPLEIFRGTAMTGFPLFGVTFIVARAGIGIADILTFGLVPNMYGEFFPPFIWDAKWVRGE